MFCETYLYAAYMEYDGGIEGTMKTTASIAQLLNAGQRQAFAANIFGRGIKLSKVDKRSGADSPNMLQWR